ncbi:MAG: TonB-dependent receptor [Parvibaculaceae bacterium]|nr:TonB-dependent receptor [Parvibaculaceae bacterium]
MAAEDATVLPTIYVETTAEEKSKDLGYTPLTEASVSAQELMQIRSSTNDTASLFKNVAGFSLVKAGGVSNLPVLNGFADDRIRVLVDGMALSAACPNHMNPALSYIDPSNVGSATVIAGITPVSMGGDSIAGTISVDSPPPRFGTSEDVSLVAATASTFYRSNANALSGSVSATLATDTFSLGYSGSGARAGKYDGGGNDGVVRSSEYKSYNHSLTLAAREDNHLVVLEVGQQYIPYEGYPNQYMDMTDNRSLSINGRYEGDFDWGAFKARAYWQGVDHEMNFLEDKGGIANGGMPMNTTADNFGYAAKATFNFQDGGILRIGNELHIERLEDWWPPVAGSMMMSPNTFISINGGERDRLGTFVEWDANWSDGWSSQVGIRNDTVWTDTGDVQSYGCGMMCGTDDAAAIAFNAAEHARTFVNFDLTAIAKYEPSDTMAIEFGYGRKSRAPNIYELYSWGRGSMASRMVNWLGDGNGYVGNLELDAEVAHTLSATYSVHDAARSWDVTVTPYYSYVEDYIGVQELDTFSGGFSLLQFVNHDAELYGVNLSGHAELWNSVSSGQGTLSGTLSYVRGRDLSNDDDLYHIMPLNASLKLEEVYNNWTGYGELKAVARKSVVSDVQHEPTTPAYALVNLGGSYSWNTLRVDVGIDNLFDTAYDAPLGGLSLGDYKATGILRPVPGEGRSFNIGLSFAL